MSNFGVKFRKWAATAGISGLLLAYFFILVDLRTILDRTIFYAFQSRDIGRALKLLAGSPIFFGPEMTGGGNLPGPFYYLLLTPGLMASADWRGAWYLMLALAGMSALIGWFFFKGRRMPVAGLLFVTLLPLCVITQHYMTLFINPSYLFIATTLACVWICDSFSPSLTDNRRNRSFVLAAVTVSLGIQIHFSIIFLFFAALFMQWRARRLNLPSVGRFHFRWGLAVFALPFVPYLVWNLSVVLGHPIGQPSVYVGDVADVWPTMLHLLSAAKDFDLDANARRMGIQFLNNTPWALVLALFALFFSRFFKIKNSQASAEDMAHRARGLEVIKPIAICAAFGFIPFSYVFIVPIANRYSLPMVVPLLFLTAAAVDSQLNCKIKRWLYIGLLTLVALPILSLILLDPGSPADPVHLFLGAFLALLGIVLTYIHREKLPVAQVTIVTLTALLASIHLQMYRSGGLRSNENNMVRYGQWITVWSEIYKRTGWTTEELKGRVYFVNAHTNGDPEPTYRTVMRELGPVTPSAIQVPDGYLLIINPPVGEIDLQEWLLSQPIYDELKDSLRKGEIELLEQISGPVWAIAYRVRPSSNLSKQFHNWGLYYNTSDHAAFLSGFDDNKAYNLGEDRYFFKWNECPDAHPYCDSAAQVALQRQDPERLHVRVNIIGESLSQNSPWIHPTWTQSWNDPYVELRCGGRTHKLKLAASIGYRREYLVYEPVTLYFVGNNSILAPFARDFTIDCADSPTEIAVGRASSNVDQVRGSLTLPAQRLSLEL